jgi:hypothetical protein
MCFGPARSFSKKLYSQLRYPDDCPTDAYSYLFAKKIGYKFVSVKNPPALFKVPSSITDHIRQSSRFVTGQRTLGEQFGESEVKEEFRIPRGLLLREGIKELYAHPIFVCVFVFLNLYVRMTQSRYRFTSRWEIATTTKSLYWP